MNIAVCLVALTFASKLPDGHVAAGHVRDCAVSTRRPAGLRNLPHLQSRQPLFGTVVLAGHSYRFVLDTSRAGGPYEQLHFDSAGSGDLAKQAPLHPQRVVRGATFFMPVTARVRVGGCSYPYQLALRIRRRAALAAAGLPPNTARSAPSPWDCAIRSLGCWRGSVRLDGRVLPVALQDADSNGVYGDRWQPDADSPVGRTPGDRIYLDRNRDGRLDVEDNEVYGLGEIVLASGGFYRAEVRSATTGPMLLFSAMPTGLISCSDADFEVTLLYGDYQLELKDHQGHMTAPVGDYILYNWTVVRTDAAGRRWSALVAPETERRIRITLDRPLTLSLAASLRSRCKATVDVNDLRREVTFLPELLTAQGDRVVVEFSIGPTPPVQVRIVDSMDNPVARISSDPPRSGGVSDKFKWNAPPGLPDKLCALVERDTGPFPLAPSPGTKFDLSPHRGALNADAGGASP